MISARQLSIDILMQLGEIHEREHSDEELLRCINQILSYVNIALVNIGSSYVKKEYYVRARDRGTTLPEDFIAFSDWEEDFDEDDDTWKIIGDKVTVPSDNTMEYYYQITPITSLDEYIDLPYFLYLLFLRFCVNLLQGKLKSDEISDSVTSALEEALNNQTPPNRPFPFYV